MIIKVKTFFVKKNRKNCMYFTTKIDNKMSFRYN